MSAIINAARDLMAVMSPVTGTRAEGVVTVKASGSSVTLEQGTYALPRFDNALHSDLVIKVGAGPNSDNSWTVTAGGTDVDFIANIGGPLNPVLTTADAMPLTVGSNLISDAAMILL